MIGFTWLQARSIPFPWLFSAWNSRKLAGCYLWQGKKHSDMGPGREWMLHAWHFLWRKWWQTRRQLWDNSCFQPKVNVLYFGRGPLKHCSMTCQTWRPLGGLELVCRCRKTSCLLAAHWYLNMPQGPQGVARDIQKRAGFNAPRLGKKKLSAIHIIHIRMHQGDLLPPSFPDPDLSWLLPRMPQVMALVPEHVRNSPTNPLVDWSVFQTKVSPPTGKGRIEGLWNLIFMNPHQSYINPHWGLIKLLFL